MKRYLRIFVICVICLLIINDVRARKKKKERQDKRSQLEKSIKKAMKGKGVKVAGGILTSLFNRPANKPKTEEREELSVETVQEDIGHFFGLYNEANITSELIARTFSNDSIVMFKETPTVTGLDEIKAFYENAVTEVPSLSTPVVEKMIQKENTKIIYYTYTSTSTNGVVDPNNRVIQIWEKVKGQWKVVLMMQNTATVGDEDGVDTGDNIP